MFKRIVSIFMAFVLCFGMLSVSAFAEETTAPEETIETIPEPTESVPEETEALPEPTESVPEETEALTEPTASVPEETEALTEAEQPSAAEETTDPYLVEDSGSDTVSIAAANASGDGSDVELGGLELSKIEILTLPTKTVYKVGESLDTTGLKIKATYNDGSDKTITSGFTTSRFSSSWPGTKTITVTYEKKTTTFQVKVIEVITPTLNVVASATITAPKDGWQKGANTFTVSSSTVCYVAVSYDGGTTYTRLTAAEAGSGYSFTAENMDKDTILEVRMKGDANGDGKISAADYNGTRAIALKKKTGTVLGIMAVDSNNDGTIKAAEYNKLRAVALGKSSYSW